MDFAENYSFVSQHDHTIATMHRPQYTLGLFISVQLTSCLMLISVQYSSMTISVFMQWYVILFLALKQHSLHPKLLHYFTDGYAARYKSCKVFKNSMQLE